MDAQAFCVTRDEIWRLQADLKSVAAVQSELMERFARLERRQDDDTRMKSVWGHSSSFPGVLSGTPQQDVVYNPAAEAFKNFDQDQTSSMLGSLHIDTEEEPRRGASRANSVRFDERSLHGHLGHNSRSSSEFFPVRTNSALESHPLTERSSSHKSDGRQSSTGHSAHSTRLNSLGQDTRIGVLSTSLQTAPPPGLFLLGPLPGIIRCWLDTNFSNESLLYAAVCSGSCKSTLSLRTIKRLGLEDKTSKFGEIHTVSIRVYLPEATVQHSNVGPASPMPQLPALAITFEVLDVTRDTECIDIVIGSDVLRAQNADILFSQSKVTLLDDERNRLEIPLVRPENDAVFQSLLTLSAPSVRTTTVTPHGPKAPAVSDVLPNTTIGLHSATDYNFPPPSPPPQSRSQHGISVGIGANIVGYTDSTTSRSLTSHTSAHNIPDDRQENQQRHMTQGLEQSKGKDSTEEPSDEAPKEDQRSLLGSWRRNTQPQRVGSFSSVASNRGQPKLSREHKAMKILRPSRTNASRSSSTYQTTADSDTLSLRWPEVTIQSQHLLRSPEASAHQHEPDTPVGEQGPMPLTGAEHLSRPSNPIGGGSAFGWLNTTRNRKRNTAWLILSMEISRAISSTDESPVPQSTRQRKS